MKSQPKLQVTNLSVHFGSLAAVNNVSLEVFPGQIVGLIGPNGAGKTTTFNAITGLQIPTTGHVYLNNAEITNMLPNKICKLGMSRTFQVTRAFSHMTVEDAIRVGAYNRLAEKEVAAKVDEVIRVCDLASVRGKLCSDLGLAILRRVELARALATQPEILLLDEAGAGLNNTELAAFMDLLRKLNREEHITLLIVEHVMQMVMGICDQIVVLDSGEVIAKGNPQEISTNERVIEAYLGKRRVNLC
jgi:branched-chain amino acid transport system ATP-binding protein